MTSKPDSKSFNMSDEECLLRLEALDALPDPIFILTESGRYAAIIGGPDRSMYHDGSCLVDFSLYDVLPPEKADWFLAEIRQTLEEGCLRIVEYALAGTDVGEIDPTIGPDGKIWFEGRVQPMNTLVHGERAVIWLARNNTRSHAHAAQLRALSETDVLTGIANRRRLMQFLGQWLANYQPGISALTLFIIDIDYFKPINDKYGHMDGDRVIQQLVARCTSELGEQHLLARLGGDELALVIADMAPDAAAEIAEGLRRSVAERAFTLKSGTCLSVTVSIGASAVHPDRRRLDDLLRDADLALYKAKREGRNRLVMAPCLGHAAESPRP